MVAVTNTHSIRQISVKKLRTPSANSVTPATPERIAGVRKLRRNPSMELLRQASNGPTPDRNNPTGIFTLLKNAGPTLILLPVSASEITGNIVPHSTVKQAASSTRLLNKKLDS